MDASAELTNHPYNLPQYSGTYSLPRELTKGIYPQHLYELIEKVTKELDMHSVQSTRLMLGTIAQESNNGYYLVQLHQGPAKGICQVEPTTEKLVWNWLEAQGLTDLLTNHGYKEPNITLLTYDLWYNVAIARLLYRSIKKPLPETIIGMAEYWHNYYNRNPNVDPAQFVVNYHYFVGTIVSV
jgi:hypothetical protein